MRGILSDCSTKKLENYLIQSGVGDLFILLESLTKNMHNLPVSRPSVLSHNRVYLCFCRDRCFHRRFHTLIASTLSAEAYPVRGTDGAYHVVYELLLTNTKSVPATIQKVEVLAGVKVDLRSSRAIPDAE